MDHRLQFVAEAQRTDESFTAPSARYGVAPKTGYEWLARYEAEGTAGLHERSRRLHTSPTATSSTVADALLELRRRHPRRGHPTWGGKKLLAVLARRRLPDLTEPSSPQQNGRHERIHRTLEAEATKPAAATHRRAAARVRPCPTRARPSSGHTGRSATCRRRVATRPRCGPAQHRCPRRSTRHTGRSAREPQRRRGWGDARVNVSHVLADGG
jgi:hypothetical protein